MCCLFVSSMSPSPSIDPLDTLPPRCPLRCCRYWSSPSTPSPPPSLSFCSAAENIPVLILKLPTCANIEIVLKLPIDIVVVVPPLPGSADPDPLLRHQRLQLKSEALDARSPRHGVEGGGAAVGSGDGGAHRAGDTRGGSADGDGAKNLRQTSVVLQSGAIVSILDAISSPKMRKFALSRTYRTDVLPPDLRDRTPDSRLLRRLSPSTR